MVTGISTPLFVFVKEVQTACLNDSEAVRVTQLIESGKCQNKKFSLVNQQLYYRNQVFVPVSGNWRDKVIKEFHGGREGGTLVT